MLSQLTAEQVNHAVIEMSDVTQSLLLTVNLITSSFLSVAASDLADVSQHRFFSAGQSLTPNSLYLKHSCTQRQKVMPENDTTGTIRTSFRRHFCFVCHWL